LTLEDEDENWTSSKKTTLIGSSNMTRSGSVKDLIFRFDGSAPTPPPRLGSLKIKRQEESAQHSGKMKHESRDRGNNQNPVSREPSEAKTQETSEQKRHTEKKSDEKHSSKEQKCQRSKDKPHASHPGPVSGRDALVIGPDRSTVRHCHCPVPSAALLHCESVCNQPITAFDFRHALHRSAHTNQSNTPVSMSLSV
ncbi:hypothetical protein M9458_042844, partial [Cirrhinus mrigala]